jgi:hypothetical protein
MRREHLLAGRSYGCGRPTPSAPMEPGLASAPCRSSRFAFCTREPIRSRSWHQSDWRPARCWRSHSAPWVEFRPKRPVMIAMDLVRFGAQMTVPIAYLLGWLTFLQLLLVSVGGGSSEDRLPGRQRRPSQGVGHAGGPTDGERAHDRGPGASPIFTACGAASERQGSTRQLALHPHPPRPARRVLQPGAGGRSDSLRSASVVRVDARPTGSQSPQPSSSPSPPHCSCHADPRGPVRTSAWMRCLRRRGG